jgi:dolichol kinase
LGISDPLAATFGMTFHNKTRKITILDYTFDKTILGSMVFFLSTFFISWLTLFFFDYSMKEALMLSFVIAIVNTLIELISSKGIDNLSVPLMTMMVLLLVT